MATRMVQLLWDEDPHDDFDPAVELATTGVSINTQFVNLFFVDVDLGVEVRIHCLDVAKDRFCLLLACVRLFPTLPADLSSTFILLFSMKKTKPVLPLRNIRSTCG